MLKPVSLYVEHTAHVSHSHRSSVNVANAVLHISVDSLPMSHSTEQRLQEGVFLSDSTHHPKEVKWTRVDPLKTPPPPPSLGAEAFKEKKTLKQ